MSGGAAKEFVAVYAKEADGTWRAAIQLPGSDYSVRLEGVPGEELNERIFAAIRVLHSGPVSVAFVPEEQWVKELRNECRTKGSDDAAID